MAFQDDGRLHSVPIEFRRQDDYKYYGFNYLFDRRMPHLPGSFKQKPERKSKYGFRRTTMVLTVACALILVLAIITAGLAASQATKGRKTEEQCARDKMLVPLRGLLGSSADGDSIRSLVQQITRPCSGFCTSAVRQTLISTAACPSATRLLTTTLWQTSSSSCVSNAALLQTTTVTVSVLSPTFSSSQPAMATCPSSTASNQMNTLQPANDCSSLSPTYTLDTSEGVAAFQIHCANNLPTGSDMLEVYVYSFVDCIKGCASYNHNTPVHQDSFCYAVTYHPGNITIAGGNCFFKYQSNTTLEQDENSNAAVWVPQ